MNNETVSSNGNSAATLVNHVNRVLNLGLDVHYRQVTVAMQEDGGRIKAAGKMGHAQFLNWVGKKLEEGWQIYSCYESALRQRIAALAPAILPKGVGAYSAAVLHYELRGFEHFQNRRQVGSITGLCPGVHLSDGRGKEGSINRCGIGIVRWTLVEMVWRLMIWQPQYPPVRRLAAGFVKSRRAKKRLVVQAARRLAIDLWRLSTGQTTPEKLGLVMQYNPPRAN